VCARVPQRRNVRVGVARLLTTRVADIVVEEEGLTPIVTIRIKPGVRQSIDDARENVEACILAAGHRSCRLLVDIRRGEVIPPEVRHFCSGDKLIEWFSAMALLVEGSPVGRVMVPSINEAPPAQSPSEPPASLEGLAVLLAEDNVDLLECYTTWLELVGCRVATRDQRRGRRQPRPR
jgi:hypothetical protein